MQRFESDATWFACAYLPNNPRTSVRRTPGTVRDRSIYLLASRSLDTICETRQLQQLKCFQNQQFHIAVLSAGFAFTRDNNNAQYTLAAAYLLSVYADYRTAANRTNISCEGTIYSSADIVAFAKSQVFVTYGQLVPFSHLKNSPPA